MVGGFIFLQPLGNLYAAMLGYPSIFDHADRYNNLEKNPVHKVDKMGGKEAGEMQFGTKDEYLRFSEAIPDRPLAFCAFEVTEPKTRKPVRTIKMPACRLGEGPQARRAGDQGN